MSENKTIKSVIKDGLCTGCGTCVAICPKKAIEMEINWDKGTYVPAIDKDKCNECRLCFEVCPGHNVDFKKLNVEVFGNEPEDIRLGNYLECYIGHTVDTDMRYNSTSGGLVTEILVFALEKGIIDGALVTRMKVNSPFEPEPFIARTREDLIAASKSKYCPVPANIALREILGAKNGEKFAVVGLPCHIQGVRKAELVNTKLRDRIVIHIGLFCGCTCSFRGTEFLLHQSGLNRQTIEQINYRGEGWPGGMSLQKNDNSSVFIPLSEYWTNKFTAFALPRCALCSDATAELADISFADAWGLASNNIGESVVISRNETGDGILKQMLSEEIIEIIPLKPNKIVHTQKAVIRKKSVKARFHLFRIIGKKVPAYNQNLLKPGFMVYVAGIWLIMRMILASNRRLWGVLNVIVLVFEITLRWVKLIKSKLG